MRRATDVVGALLLALIAIPVGLLVALCVLVIMGRPVLFRQRRSGRGGREFDIVKFRTMRAAAFPEQDDAERTPTLGAALRTASLDEVPQLWNVLRGDMSFIGPRPTLPEQVVHYTPRQRGRLAVRPGITGWAQVNGRNSLGWPERIELDLWYLEHRSVRLDALILVRTVTSVVRRAGITGADGVNPDFPVPGPRPAP